jgi:hypothetical protein
MKFGFALLGSQRSPANSNPCNISVAPSSHLFYIQDLQISTFPVANKALSALTPSSQPLSFQHLQKQSISVELIQLITSLDSAITHSAPLNPFAMNTDHPAKDGHPERRAEFRPEVEGSLFASLAVLTLMKFVPITPFKMNTSNFAPNNPLCNEHLQKTGGWGPRPPRKSASPLPQVPSLSSPCAKIPPVPLHPARTTIHPLRRSS